MSVYDLAVTDALLTTTRSVRKRLDLEKPVPDEVIRECLEIALQAPSGSNRQGWHWIVITDPAKRQALGDLYRKGAGSYIEDAYNEAKNSGAEANARVFDSARYLVERIQDVPVHVVPCVDVSHIPDDAPRSGWTGILGSIYPAVWNFNLALRARGLGTVLTTLHLRCDAESAELLGTPPHIMQACLLPVAYTVGTDFKPAPRQSLEGILHRDSFSA